MTPRRIAYVLKIFPKISETFIAGELAELKRRGIELRILSLLPPREGLRHEFIADAGLDKLTIYGRENFSGALKEFKPQLLHAHFATESTATARELSGEFAIPFTFTAHGYDIHRKPPPDFANRAAAASAVVTVSEANAKYIAKTFGVAGEQLHVISCGVDTETFRPANAVHDRTPLILCVARLVKVKNLGLLLRACATLRGRGARFRCVMIGDGPCREELENLRAQLKLDEVVEMPGAAAQREVLKWWQRASVGVLTSENEGMPVSLMEAAACGVPVVATNVGGVPELVEDGVNGFLAKPDEADDLATKIARLLEDAALRRTMSVSARKRADEKFSVRRQVDSLLALWSEVVKQPRPNLTRTFASRTKLTKIPVTDTFNAIADTQLPTLSNALDPVQVKDAFKRAFPRLAPDGFVVPKSIRVTRHKPGRRAVVEYDVRIERHGERVGKAILLGKVRARRSGNEGYRLLEAIWNAGFDANTADGISVPEPIGVVPEFQMWFQRKVRGQTAAELLPAGNGIELAARIADAVHKLHRANVAIGKVHTMADELNILRKCFDNVVAQKSDWAERIERLWRGCKKAGESLPNPRTRGIHRDFYPAQVIVDKKRLWLIDFDLYCVGDPGLDAGNFLGHMTEQALREYGDVRALEKQEHAFEERFVALSGERVRASVKVYANLTLARHIYLSTQFFERQKLTEALLELCERRIALR